MAVHEQPVPPSCGALMSSRTSGGTLPRPTELERRPEGVADGRADERAGGAVGAVHALGHSGPLGDGEEVDGAVVAVDSLQEPGADLRRRSPRPVASRQVHVTDGTLEDPVTRRRTLGCLRRALGRAEA